MDVLAIKAMVDAGELPNIAACRAELSRATSVIAIVNARIASITHRLDQLQADTEGELAAGTKSSAAAATKARRRSEAGEKVPELGDALANGDTTTGHVDLVAKALASLSPADQQRLATHGDDIRAKASQLDEPSFRRWLEALVRRVRTDDAVRRLERQKGMCRARWWTDHDGMVNLAARFDPESGARLQGLTRNAVEALFHGSMPDGAPLDPFERQNWLQALALIELLDHADLSGVARTSAPDITVLIDAQTLLHGEHEHSIIDLGPYGLPVETIRRWACLGEVTPVVVGADGTHLLLGRTTRLANREQRRALRAWYRTCACCDVLYEHCQIHHVTWWELGGRTDIGSLVPLCSRHHHLVHEGGWKLHLDRNRVLRVTLPNGEVHEHGPPMVRAA